MNQFDHVTCDEVFRQLDDYLDRELAPQEIRKLQRHLEICAQCAREVRFETSVLEGVRRKLRRIQLPSDLGARIHAEIDRLRNDPRHGGTREGP